ncbi:F-box/kelch-repeat protein [Trifolium repens]|nr:F-box/kelch-repeat protein [Trifolium repens]
MSTLSFDLVEEILCRLPVRSLLQFQCVCKSWKSLISDNPKFVKKHLHISLTCPVQSHHHLILHSSTGKLGYLDSSISSIFNTVSKSIFTPTELRYPSILNTVSFQVVGSCHGIICASIPHYVIFWNPSIQNLKISPILDVSIYKTMYGFGYDRYNDNYKVVAVFCYDSGKTKVNVHTMGTNCWRKIQEFPFGVPDGESGKFVGGTVNWLVCENGIRLNSSLSIVSLDLGNESYQKILLPDYGDESVFSLTLGELRDCLCIFAYGKSSVNVWIMKEYGNNESWNKLLTIPFIEDFVGLYTTFTKVVYIYEDEQVLLVSRAKDTLKLKLVVYDSKSDTFKLPEIENINNRMLSTVYVESLITTCS